MSWVWDLLSLRFLHDIQADLASEKYMCEAYKRAKGVEAVAQYYCEILLLITTYYPWNILAPFLPPHPGSSDASCIYCPWGGLLLQKWREMSQCSVSKFQNRALNLPVEKIDWEKSFWSLKTYILTTKSHGGCHWYRFRQKQQWWSSRFSYSEERVGADNNIEKKVSEKELYSLPTSSLLSCQREAILEFPNNGGALRENVVCPTSRQEPRELGNPS